MFHRLVAGRNQLQSTLEEREGNMRIHLRNARLLVGLLAGLLAPSLCSADDRRTELSLAKRVAAQRAIEQVYWNHRVWPKENPGPKPPLSEEVPDRAIRARVEDYLKKSNALERFWQRPITAAQLQAELDRMAAHTRAPQLLSELFAVLGNDPQLIAEALARHTLADRLIRNWYAHDDRFHGELKKKAEAALAACQSVECMPSMGGEYRETTWKIELPETQRSERESRRDVILLKGEGWKRNLDRLAERFGGTLESLPVL